jgi:hypothetical protein
MRAALLKTSALVFVYLAVLSYMGAWVADLKSSRSLTPSLRAACAVIIGTPASTPKTSLLLLSPAFAISALMVSAFSLNEKTIIIAYTAY